MEPGQETAAMVGQVGAAVVLVRPAFRLLLQAAALAIHLRFPRLKVVPVDKVPIPQVEEAAQVL